MAEPLLSAEDRAYLLALMRRQINSAVHRRVNVLLLLDDGWALSRIAAALYLDESTVADHRRLYLAEGRAGVERLVYPGRTSRLPLEQRRDLSLWVAIEVPQTAKTVCAHVEAMFGVRYTAHAVARVLGEMGFVFKKPKCVPTKVDALIQQEFLDSVLSPLMALAGPDALLYFVDGCHLSYTGRPAHRWIPHHPSVFLRGVDGRSRA